MSIENYTIAARFSITTAHFIAMILSWMLIKSNVLINLSDNPSDAYKEGAFSEVEGAFAFSLFCFIADYLGIFMGHSLFDPRVNAIQIICHFVGGLFMTWFILGRWHYKTLWPIVLCSSFITGITELCVVFATYVLKIVV